MTVSASSAEACDAIAGLADFVREVGRVGELTLGVGDEVAKPAGSITLVGPDFDAYVEVGELVDLAAEKARIEKELVAGEKELAGVEKTLANEGFIAKAASEIVEKKRARAAELTDTLAALRAQLADFA